MPLDVDSVVVSGRWFRHVPAGSDPYRRPRPSANGRWQRGDVVDALYCWRQWGLCLHTCLTGRHIDELVETAFETNPQAIAWDFRLPDAIASAAAQSPSWARTILDDLLATDSLNSPYWSYIFSGLTRQGVQLEHEYLLSLSNLLGDLLGLVGGDPSLGSRLRPTSELLLSLSGRASIDAMLVKALEIVGARAVAIVGMDPATGSRRNPRASSRGRSTIGRVG